MVEPANAPTPLPVRYAAWYPSPVLVNWQRLSKWEKWKRISTTRKVVAITGTLGLVAITVATRQFGVGYFAVMGSAALWNWALYNKREPQDLTGLAPSPLPDDHFGCSLHIKADGVVYGVDEGVLSFVGGWLNWEGNLCRFSIKPPDTRMVYGSVIVYLTLHEGNELGFSPLKEWKNGEQIVREDPASLDRRLQRWRLPRLHRGDVLPSGDSILPPRTLQPACDPFRRSRTIAVVGIVVALLGAIVIALVDQTARDFVIGTALLMAALPFAASFHAYAQHRRLSRALKELAARGK